MTLVVYSSDSESDDRNSTGPGPVAKKIKLEADIDMVVKKLKRI